MECVNNKDYDAMEKMTKDILKTITNFKRNHDDCLVRFTIEITNRDNGDNQGGIEEEGRSSRKKRKIK